MHALSKAGVVSCMAASLMLGSCWLDEDRDTDGPTIQEAYLKAFNTDVSDGFGMAVAVDGDTIVVGAGFEASSETGTAGTGNDNVAADSGAVYIFVRSGGTWMQQAYLKAHNTDAGDHFGLAVAISGDTVVVGANGEDSSETGTTGLGDDDTAPTSGAAYVFVRSGSVWTQEAYLKAHNAEANDEFGAFVAVDGDAIVVGASGEDSGESGTSGTGSDNSAENSGAAYVFVRSGSSWTQEAYLKAGNASAQDYFRAVDIDGDTIVVGAEGEDSDETGTAGTGTNDDASASGAAYVFVRSGSTWSQQAYLKAHNTDAEDRFGNHVAVHGDTIVVGAYYEASNETGTAASGTVNGFSMCGAAYVFTRTAGTWTQQAYLKPHNTDPFDQFGWYVAVHLDTIVVGAFEEASNETGTTGIGDNNDAASSGAAYVFARSASTWTQRDYLKAHNAEAGDQFGACVALDGETVVVGTPSEGSSETGTAGTGADNSALGSGAVHVFR